MISCHKALQITAWSTLCLLSMCWTEPTTAATDIGIRRASFTGVLPVLDVEPGSQKFARNAAGMPTQAGVDALPIWIMAAVGCTFVALVVVIGLMTTSTRSSEEFCGTHPKLSEHLLKAAGKRRNWTEQRTEQVIRLMKIRRNSMTSDSLALAPKPSVLPGESLCILPTSLSRADSRKQDMSYTLDTLDALAEQVLSEPTMRMPPNQVVQGIWSGLNSPVATSNASDLAEQPTAFTWLGDPDELDLLEPAPGPINGTYTSVHAGGTSMGSSAGESLFSISRSCISSLDILGARRVVITPSSSGRHDRTSAFSPGGVSGAAQPLSPSSRGRINLTASPVRPHSVSQIPLTRFAELHVNSQGSGVQVLKHLTGSSRWKSSDLGLRPASTPDVTPLMPNGIAAPWNTGICVSSTLSSVTAGVPGGARISFHSESAKVWPASPTQLKLLEPMSAPAVVCSDVATADWLQLPSVTTASKSSCVGVLARFKLWFRGLTSNNRKATPTSLALDPSTNPTSTLYRSTPPADGCHLSGSQCGAPERTQLCSQAVDEKHSGHHTPQSGFCTAPVSPTALHVLLQDMKVARIAQERQHVQQRQQMHLSLVTQAGDQTNQKLVQPQSQPMEKLARALMLQAPPPQSRVGRACGYGAKL